LIVVTTEVDCFQGLRLSWWTATDLRLKLIVGTEVGYCFQKLRFLWWWTATDLRLQVDYGNETCVDMLLFTFKLTLKTRCVSTRSMQNENAQFVLAKMLLSICCRAIAGSVRSAL